MKRDKNGILRFESVDGLQSGNKILHVESGREVTVYTIHGVVKDHLDVCSEHSSVQDWVNVEQFAPIVLTPELLIESLTKANFAVTIDNDGDVCFKKNSIGYKAIQYEFYDENFDETSYTFDFNGVLIGFFHELQNYIKLLTGDKI